ncbi:ADP-ribosylglycohydrolase family protein [Streptomyces sp. NPDC049967]|uniref:ADP-ribosylglycohydrolase family protein n=1 Tax=unclassified Streptomyces TaxID=2593676 RepID=UPI002E0E7BE3|nr:MULTISPECIES: ADP-ribosylglycohydrolase family protein [unclassified Streptomyces]WRZ10634.1 ADP-ribosylglycohydrolase family protein [Streptomyces sp. NBC_00341]WSJ21699.1 ADP-ribosylglycohydrolase family protein [Streptomyces sp. NBC_01324]
MIVTRTITKQAATGALTGLALGDALGFPTEFNNVPSILAKCGPWRQMRLPKPAVVSDDTQMTLALGRGIRSAMDRGLLTPMRLVRPVREEFVDWYHSPDNNRAPGRTCMTACRMLDSDRVWQEASQTGSKGCGANMRVAPIGLVPGLSDEQRAGAAQLQAALTHGHPTALAASDLMARAVYLLAQGAEPVGLIGQLRSYAYENSGTYLTRWLGDLWRYAGDSSPELYIQRGWEECLTALERVQDALRDPSPETDPCEATGDGWIAEEALATALHCFLLFPGEPVTALRRAACTRGDSDSLGCLTGALAGAHLGSGAWPKEWSERIEYRSDLLSLGALWDS